MSLGRIAGALLALSFGVTAALKVEALTGGVDVAWRLGIPGRTWLWIGTVAEAMIAAALLSRWYRYAGIAAIIHTLIALLFLWSIEAQGTNAAGCGCFGIAKMGEEGHYKYLAATLLLAVVVLMDGSKKCSSVRAAEEHAPGRTTPGRTL